MPKNQIKRPFFHPTFGSRPAQIVGRNKEIEQFLSGLQNPVGSRERCTFFIGQRGMGKTALLLELAEKAADYGYVVALVTAYEDMPDEIIEIIQQKGQKYLPKERGRKVQGVDAGAFGFSFGLTFSDEVTAQYGFRTKLSLLSDRLEEYDKGILILIDEAKTSEAMRQIAVTYQHLIGEDKNIAIAMAGLPQAISGVLNDDVLTFLNRANKVHLEAIRNTEIRIYFKKAFEQMEISISEELLEEAVRATHGFPYLMQLIGYYMIQYADEKKMITRPILGSVLTASRKDMEENVFEPILKPLSENDVIFLKAMAQDEGASKSADIGERLGKGNSFVQPYRARLIEAGVIESPRKGYLEFAIPYLKEYLRNVE